ncbi:SEC10/PgrA surface exclusion domain-containing protein [Streptococcus porci]|uniref:SEC10/PgrA surface exclusion domain-containing protein n=1 Tax=Streptococcus porci TaxID=502567 RepID=UPI0003F77A6D|nr:SEC10/PgrA surface exclusion domain-containing protein [Streptococcus porci]
MFKNDVKGHGTIKKLRTGAVVSVLALSAVGGTGVVSADEVGASGTAEVVSTTNATEPVSEVVTEPVKEEPRITDEQVATAKAESDSANQAVQAQEGVVSELGGTVATAEGTVNGLTNQVNEVSNVTPEVVESAKVEADQAGTALETASEGAKSAETSLSDATSKVEAQEGVVSDAKAEVDKSASAVADAEKKVSDLSGTVDTAQLEQDVKDLTSTVAKDKEVVQSAKDALTTAQTAETNKAEAIKTQEGVVSKATADEKTASDALATAQTALDSKTREVKTVQGQLDEAKKGKEVTETVQTGTETISTGGKTTLNDGVAASAWYESNGVLTNDEYLTAIKNLAEGKGSVEDVNKAIKHGFFGMDDESLDDLNNVMAPNSTAFKSWRNIFEGSLSNTDATTLVDVDNLTDAQLTDLALFYTALVNDLRSKVGTEPLKVTKGSLQNSKDVVESIFNATFPAYKGMTNDQKVANGFWNTLSGLNSDTGATGQPALKAGSGVSVEEAVASSVGSNTIIGLETANSLQYAKSDGRKQTMADLKFNLLATLGVQLYGIDGRGELGEAFGGLNGGRASGYATALEVLGLGRNKHNSVGLGFEFVDIFNGGVDRAPKTFIVFSDSSDSAISSPYETVTGGKVETVPVYETRTTTVVDQAEVARLGGMLVELTAEQAQSQKAVEDAQKAYDEAKTALDTAKQQLDNLKSGTVDIPALKQAVKDAETQLEKDQASLQTAKETLAVAKASAVDKANALAKAKADLVSAQASNDKANVVLKEEQETLELLRKAEGVAKLTVTEANAKLADAKLASDEATAKYEELSKALANKDAVLPELTAKLEEAKQALAVARAEYETAKDLLASLRVTAKEKLDAYRELADLKAEQDKAEAEAKRLQELKDKADAITKDGGIATAVVDGNGVVIDYVDGKEVTPDTPTKVVKQAGVTQVGDKITYSRVEKNKNLPETGSEESLLGLLGASIIAGLGLSVTNKRRKTR